MRRLFELVVVGDRGVEALIRAGFVSQIAPHLRLVSRLRVEVREHSRLAVDDDDAVVVQRDPRHQQVLAVDVAIFDVLLGPVVVQLLEPGDQVRLARERSPTLQLLGTFGAEALNQRPMLGPLFEFPLAFVVGVEQVPLDRGRAVDGERLSLVLLGRSSLQGRHRGQHVLQALVRNGESPDFLAALGQQHEEPLLPVHRVAFTLRGANRLSFWPSPDGFCVFSSSLDDDASSPFSDAPGRLLVGLTRAVASGGEREGCGRPPPPASCCPGTAPGTCPEP